MAGSFGDIGGDAAAAAAAGGADVLMPTSDTDDGTGRRSERVGLKHRFLVLGPVKIGLGHDGCFGRSYL